MEKSQTLYKRILVKLSGEALVGNLEYGIEPSVIKRIADELIQVIVSLGIKIEVPEVEGLVYEDAINILEELGLVATVTGDTNGVVRKQIPRKGEFVEPESVVELTFGS